MYNLVYVDILFFFLMKMFVRNFFLYKSLYLLSFLFFKLEMMLIIWCWYMMLESCNIVLVVMFVGRLLGLSYIILDMISDG